MGNSPLFFEQEDIRGGKRAGSAQFVCESPALDEEIISNRKFNATESMSFIFNSKEYIFIA